MTQFIRIIAIVTISSLALGCATVTRGGKQTVKMITDPPGATVVVNGKSYTAPADVTLQRKKKYDVVATHPGYQGIHFVLKGKWDAGGVGAVAMDAAVPGGSALFIIDTLSGSDREFSKQITIKLPPAVGQGTEPILLYEFKGQLLNKDEYAAAKKKATTQEAADKKAKKEKKKSGEAT